MFVCCPDVDEAEQLTTVKDGFVDGDDDDDSWLDDVSSSYDDTMWCDDIDIDDYLFDLTCDTCSLDSYAV